MTDYRAKAAAARQAERDSFDRCDTDGFVSQWVSGLSARKYDLMASIEENGGRHEFLGLYQGERRVKARMIFTRFGSSWLLHEDEVELIQARGKKFMPTGFNSRILKQFGLEERWEMAPAYATYSGNGTGLSGLASCSVVAVRKGCKWGSDAVESDRINDGGV